MYLTRVDDRHHFSSLFHCDESLCDVYGVTSRHGLSYKVDEYGCMWRSYLDGVRSSLSRMMQSDKWDRETPLTLAAWNGQADAVYQLLMQGAQVEATWYANPEVMTRNLTVGEIDDHLPSADHIVSRMRSDESDFEAAEEREYQARSYKDEQGNMQYPYTKEWFPSEVSNLQSRVYHFVANNLKPVIESEIRRFNDYRFNFPGKNGLFAPDWTPLLIALHQGHDEVARLLVVQGNANVARDGHEIKPRNRLVCPVLLAAEKNNIRVAPFIIRRGNGPTRRQLDAALRLCVDRCFPDFIKFILGQSDGVSGDVLLETFSKSIMISSYELVEAFVTYIQPPHHPQIYECVAQSLLRTENFAPATLIAKAIFIREADRRLDQDRTLLMFTSRFTCYNEDLTQWLIQNGANVSAISGVTGQTPLGEAAEGGNLLLVKQIIALGADINYVSAVDGQSILFKSGKSGSLELFDLLLASAKVDLQEVDKAGFTLLMITVAFGHFNLTRRVFELKEKPNVNVISVDGRTPLILALELGGWDGKNVKQKQQGSWDEIEMVTFLIDKGADVNLCPRDISPLMYAIVRQWNRAALLLVQRGANVNWHDRFGSTALEFLLKKMANTPGAERFVPPFYGDSEEGLLWSLLRMTDIVHLSQNTKGETLASIAIKGLQKLQVVETLFNAGIPIDQLNERGATPLMEAACVGTVDIGQLLLARGADVELKAPAYSFIEQPEKKYDDARDLPWNSLMIASYNGRTDFVTLVIEHIRAKNGKKAKLHGLKESIRLAHYHAGHFSFFSRVTLSEKDPTLKVLKKAKPACTIL